MTEQRKALRESAETVARLYPESQLMGTTAQELLSLLDDLDEALVTISTLREQLGNQNGGDERHAYPHESDCGAEDGGYVCNRQSAHGGKYHIAYVGPEEEVHRWRTPTDAPTVSKPPTPVHANQEEK